MSKVGATGDRREGGLTVVRRCTLDGLYLFGIHLWLEGGPRARGGNIDIRYLSLLRISRFIS